MTLCSTRAAVRSHEQQAPHARIARAAAGHGNLFSAAKRRRNDGSESAKVSARRSLYTCSSNAAVCVRHTAALHRSTRGLRWSARVTVVAPVSQIVSDSPSGSNAKVDRYTFVENCGNAPRASSGDEEVVHCTPSVLVARKRLLPVQAVPRGYATTSAQYALSCGTYCT